MPKSELPEIVHRSLVALLTHYGGQVTLELDGPEWNLPNIHYTVNGNTVTWSFDRNSMDS